MANKMINHETLFSLCFTSQFGKKSHTHVHSFRVSTYVTFMCSNKNRIDPLKAHKTFITKFILKFRAINSALDQLQPLRHITYTTFKKN